MAEQLNSLNHQPESDTAEPYQKIVITGGPCAGKSSILGAISETYGNNAITVPEAATLALGSIPENMHPENGWKGKDLQQLEDVVVRTQLLLEARAEKAAEDQEVKAIVCDRGLIDVEAYLPGTIEKLAQELGTSPAELRDRYDEVIFLDSSATLGNAAYDQQSNPQRLETAEVAREVNQKTYQAWRQTGNVLRVPAREEFEPKRQEVINLVGAIALEAVQPSPENELKLQLPEPPHDLLRPENSTHITQGYLQTLGGYEERVRKTTNSKSQTHYTHTKKYGEGLVRYEDESSITQAEFESLFSRSIGHIQKERYQIEGSRWVVDVFGGHHQGLVIAEVELSKDFTESQAHQQCLFPDTKIKDITNSREFYNKNLALENNTPQQGG